MDLTWHATDSDDWEHVLPPDGPPSRRLSLPVIHTFERPAPGVLENDVSFFDSRYDHILTKYPRYIDALYSDGVRNTIRDAASKSRSSVASDAPVRPSTETDVNSPVGQGHFAEIEVIRRQKPKEPSTTIDASTEWPISPDAAHCYDPSSQRSNTPYTVEPFTWEVLLLKKNTRPLQLQPDLSDRKQILDNNLLDLLFSPKLKNEIAACKQETNKTPPLKIPSPQHAAFPYVRFSVIRGLGGRGKSTLARFIQLNLNNCYDALLRTIVNLESVTSSHSLNKHVTTNTGLMKQYSDHVIPGLLDSQHSVDATGDTGAKYNFLNEDYAKQCQFKIDSTSRRPITIASGQKVMTAGITEVSFCFRGERTPHLLEFHILPGCVKNVILGKSFLKATETFSNALHFAKRVVKRMTRKLNTHQVLFLGASPPMFTGLLNGETKTALADSASKVLIMDEDYAQTLGLSIVSTKKTCIKLRFADGSTAFTSGKTYDVSWQFGTGKRFPLDFYILKNAPADVILSEDFLLRETKAFIEYADCLMEEDEDADVGYYNDNDDDDFFFAICRDENYHPQAYTEGADQYFEDDREDARRTEEDLHIASLIGDEKDAAIARAKERRAQWAAKQAANNLAQGSQNNTTNTASSSVAPQAQTNNAAGVPSISKRQRWRFKLMKKRKAGPTGQNP